MRGVRFKRLAAGVLVLSLFSSTTIFAGSSTSEQFTVFLPGIDNFGCLNYGKNDPDWKDDGDYVSFYACVNTYTGKFVFKTSGYVDNDSGYKQCFYNKNLFYYDNDVCVFSSVYCVSKNDYAYATYTGCAKDNDN